MLYANYYAITYAKYGKDTQKQALFSLNKIYSIRIKLSTKIYIRQSACHPLPIVVKMKYWT